jgi:peptidase M66-like protein
LSRLRGSAWAVLGALSAACGGTPAEQSSGAGGASRTPCDACVHPSAGEASGSAGSPLGGQFGGALVGAAGEAGSPATSDEGGAAGDSGGSPIAANGVAISEVSFWQAMRVPLGLASTPAETSAPIVLNKPGILRVFVEPGSLFHARQLTAALQFGAGPSGAPLTSTKLIRAASANGDFSTTFNFPMDAASVVADASYSVVVQDGVVGPVLARYPVAGQSALNPVSAGKTLNVVVVPLVVAGVVPNTSADAMSSFRSRVLSMYPLGDLTISVHAPVTSSIAIGPSTGWSQLLDALYALRAKDAPANNVYYYGMFTPAQRFDQYCVTDCTVGLSNVAGLHEVESRGSIGLGIFADGSNSDAPDTMAHELGHALGREHAPCGNPSGPDKLFPYEGGKVGVWGFDSLNHLLLDPSVYGDVMGYCSPDWISDYTYSAIFDRIQYVNAAVTGSQALRLEAAASVFRRVLVDAQGALAWGSPFTPSDGPQGDVRELTLLALDGTEIGSITAYFRPFSDGPGGFLSVPEAALDASGGVGAIRLGSAELSLDAPKP